MSVVASVEGKDTTLYLHLHFSQGANLGHSTFIKIKEKQSYDMMKQDEAQAMYPDVRKEPLLYLMQTPTNRNFKQNAGTSARGIIITAILLFAASGLISGFAFGAFVRSKPQTGTGPSSTDGTTATVQRTGTASVAPTEKPRALKPPSVGLYTDTEIANDSTRYDFTVQAVVQSGHLVHALDITCKLWLIRRVPVQNVVGDVKVMLPQDRLQNIGTLQNPIIGNRHDPNGDITPGFFPEIMGLHFAQSTPQTQTCPNGHGKWNYTISVSVPPGDYDLLVLTDWQGQHYNWSWRDVTITAH